MFNGPAPDQGGYKRRSLGEIDIVIVHHSASDAWRNDATIVETVRAAESWQMSQGKPAVAYHLAVSPGDERIAWLGDFETVRWHADGVERHPVYGCGVNNACSVGLLIAGDYTNSVPDAATLDRARFAVAWLRGQLPCVFKVVGHRDVAATICPGNRWSAWREALLL